MTDKRIEEIRAREQAATDGPWGTHYDGQGTYTVQAQPRLIPGFGNVDEGTVATLHGEHGDGQTYANARFIGHARDDIKFLLDLMAPQDASDTLPQWLHWRFGKHGQRWDKLDTDDQSYWEHQAAAVRRAVDRGGFKLGGQDAALALGGGE